MYTFGTMINKLEGNPKAIVFTEGMDPRVLEAALRLLASNFSKPILVGNSAAIEATVEDAGYNVHGTQIVDPENFDRLNGMVEMFCRIRKSKDVTPEQAKKILSGANYFGTMLIEMSIDDCLLGGATYSTADTVRPALRIIKTKPGNKTIFSYFILARPSATNDDELLAIADYAINIKPTEDELVEICGETVNYIRIFGIGPRVAFLSYLTVGSGFGKDADKMRNAYAEARAALPDEAINGEIQFDAAVSLTVTYAKMEDSKTTGYANTFILPGINAGNIGYKIVQRLSGFDAYGPILLGLNAPINDPSRGHNALGVCSMAIVTTVLA